MAYVIISPCVGVCDTACVEACPVDCIHGPIDPKGSGEEAKEMEEKGDLEGKQLYIDPEECIDCDACVAPCPVDAVVEDETEAIAAGDGEYIVTAYKFFGQDVPDEYQEYDKG